MLQALEVQNWQIGKIEKIDEIGSLPSILMGPSVADKSWESVHLNLTNYEKALTSEVIWFWAMYWMKGKLLSK